MSESPAYLILLRFGLVSSGHPVDGGVAEGAMAADGDSEQLALAETATHPLTSYCEG